MVCRRPEPRPASRVATLVLATLVAACGSNATPTPSTNPGTSTEPTTSDSPTTSNGPTASGEPGPGGALPSSQDLIAEDLDAGVIDATTALRYRAWALFWDPRLPERYDGAGSTGEDDRLFDEIAELAPTLGAADRAELEAYLLRPTDPRSALASAGAVAGGAVAATGAGRLSTTSTRGSAAVAAAPSIAPTQCGDIGDVHWEWDDWSPGTDYDVGIRAWVCSTSDVDAAPLLARMLEPAKKLWAQMTAGMPNGMGLPYPDTGSDQADGSGKVDIYLVDPLADCRPRGDQCRTITGTNAALAAKDSPRNCARHGFPTRACAGYIVVSSRALMSDQWPSLFAHEFFHRLQQSHNSGPAIWYTEASAAWAAWHFVGHSGAFSAAERQIALDQQYNHSAIFQYVGKSLLYWENRGGAPPQYQSWGWPLFQSVVDSPSSVFLAWQAIEDAATEHAYDDAIDAQLPFADNFRDFATWNAQPSDYYAPVSTGLDDIRWQEKPRLDGFPNIAHHTDHSDGEVTIGILQRPVIIEALDAYYERLTVIALVREITIDISGLTGAERADLDVIVGLNAATDTTPGDEWRRIRPSGDKVILCRDLPDENARTLEIVVSNHGHGRLPTVDKPDPADDVKGTFTIEGKAACEVPDHYTGTFGGSNDHGDSWHGTATFDLDTTPDPFGFTCQLGTYCYEFVSGSVDWTCASGALVSIALAPPKDDGSLTLILSDPSFPYKDRTYGGIIVPTTDKETCPGPKADYISKWTVVSWLSIVGESDEKIDADWRLSDSYSHTGCGIESCGTQSWNWAFTPIFDP